MRILSVLIAGWLLHTTFCAPALARPQLAVDLVVEGTSEATELTPGALVALNDDFDEKNEVRYTPPSGTYPVSFVRAPGELDRRDNELHDPTGAAGVHRISADSNHSNNDGDDDELADATIIITGPAGATGRWFTRVTTTSGDLRVWWFDGTNWVEVEDGVIGATLLETPSITLQDVGGTGRAEIPLKLEGLETTAAANEISLEAEFVQEGSGNSANDTSNISIVDVEIEVNLSADEGDDYVTWSPARCRARVTGMENRTENLPVVLRNAAQVDEWILPQSAYLTDIEQRIRASGVPGDPGRYSGGRVRFAPDNLAAGSTATELTHPAQGGDSLAADGSWHEFRIAGEFGRPGFYDKDTIIEAALGDVDGRPMGTHRLMVRVRKQAHHLQSFEIQRLLEAIAISKDVFHGGNKRWPNASGGSAVYASLERLHTNARLAGDEAHSSVLRQSAFLPWHRAFILEFERYLQALPGPPWEPNRYRAVTLPYWDWDEPSTRRYTRWFLGAPRFPNRTWSSGTVSRAQFDPRNPIADWAISGFPGNNRIVRRNHRATGTLADESTFRDFRRLLRFNVYGAKSSLPANSWGNGFLIRMESDAHNNGHSWNCSNGQITNPAHSAKEPAFYLLHSQVDRQWAAWQNIYNRYVPDEVGYDLSNGAAFPGGGSTRYQLGSHRDDEMWPWDRTFNGSGLRRRPPVAGTEFPSSGNLHLWPQGNTSPTCGEMHDYEGRFDPDQNMGFCYDDVPFGRGTLDPVSAEAAGVRLVVSVSGGTVQNAGTVFDVEVQAVRAAPNFSGNDVAAGPGFNGTVRLAVMSGSPADTRGPGTGVYITSTTGPPTADPADDVITFTGSSHRFRVLANSVERIQLQAVQVNGGLPGQSQIISVQ